MKILVSLICIISISVCISCNKNNTATPDYFISSTNNGINVVNMYNASASLANAGGTQNSCIMLATGDSTAITINVKSDNTINTTSTYSDVSSSDNASLIFTIKGHEQTSVNSIPGSLKVNFTKISASYIEGTFSATVANTKQDSVTAITDGKFLLPL